jgi:VCBS repeat-containing protein
MTKLASENATNKANSKEFSLKEGRAAVDGQVAVDPSAKAAVAAPLKAALNGKTGAGIAAPAPVKVNPHADAVKKDERDEDGKHINKVSDDAEGKVEHLAMVDASSAAAVGALSPEAGQDAGGASADGVSTPLIIGGVLLLGGGVALAAGGGGGKKNAPPTLPATGTATTAEDTPVTVTVTATDPGDTVTYAASGATNGTVTGGANGAFVFTPNADFNGSGTFTVTATDSKGQTATQTVTVTVTPVNDAPVITSGATATVAENAAVTTEVYKVTATDVDANTTLTYSLGGADAAFFNINSQTGSVTLKASADYEADNTYVFDVKASDGTATTTKTVTLTVTDVNEAPVITSGATATVAENAATTTVVYDANATDPDANATVTYSLSGADAALFNINAATGEVTLKASANFEAKPSYSFTVVATDNGNPALTGSKDVTLNVTDVNEVPTFASGTATATVAENAAASTVVFDASATDVDAGDVLTYSLTGADAALFNIDGATGEVTLKAPANFEADNSYTFSVVATDKGGLTATQVVTLNVTDVNEAPTFAAATATATIAENASISTVVLDANATDVDAGDVLTYSLIGDDAALFNINANTGEVTLKASANYEAVQSYDFTVVATDVGGLTAQQDVSVAVTNQVDVLSLDAGSFGAPVTIDASGNSPSDVLDVNYGFTESPGESEIIINNFGVNDFIQFNGVDAGDYNYQSSGNDLILTFLQGGTLSTITLTDVLLNGAVVNSEATAEIAVAAALGVTDNVGGYFVGNAPAAVVALDPNDGVDIYNAAGASVTFTDNGTLESDATILNFRSDDVISFLSTVAGDVLYSNGDDAADLRIDYFDPISGNQSTIILDNVLDAGELVFDFNSAAVALGRSDFVTFA